MRCKCPVDSLLCRAYGSLQELSPLVRPPLMRCKCPLINLLCRVDKHFLHLYGSYDSTTITWGLLPTRQATKFLSLLKRCKSPLDSLLCRVDKQVPLMRWKCPVDSLLCQADKNFLHSYGSYDLTAITWGLLPTRQATKFLSPFNEMQNSVEWTSKSP